MQGFFNAKEKEIAKLIKDLEKSTSPTEAKRLEREIKELKEERNKQRAKNDATIEENQQRIPQLRQPADENPENLERKALQ